MSNPKIRTCCSDIEIERAHRATYRVSSKKECLRIEWAHSIRIIFNSVDSNSIVFDSWHQTSPPMSLLAAEMRAFFKSISDAACTRNPNKAIVDEEWCYECGRRCVCVRSNARLATTMHLIGLSTLHAHPYGGGAHMEWIKHLFWPEHPPKSISLNTHTCTRHHLVSLNLDPSKQCKWLAKCGMPFSVLFLLISFCFWSLRSWTMQFLGVELQRVSHWMAFGFGRFSWFELS